MSKLMGLFPTPLMKIEGVLDAPLCDGLIRKARDLSTLENTGDSQLAHTEMLDPNADAHCRMLAERAFPHVIAFGETLFAARLNWLVKEMWLNVLEPGGSQFMHTHANSFVSGIFYVTESHGASNTMFRRPSGGAEFIFRNDVPLGHPASDTWMLDDVRPGDLVLYPSYLMHGVPPNQGDQRITVAFNAVPDRLDSLGYRVSFGP